MLGACRDDFGAAVVIAQHRQDDGRDGMLERLLDAHCALAVSEAEDKLALDAGAVVVAPAGYHLLVERGAVSLSVDEPLHFSRPVDRRPASARRPTPTATAPPASC